ncbi:S8 family peptidase [Microbacterium luticocti]|uniref:S8 family peptidase n=1 Tax=Microbacterium luticocti TaxID=451764 RepID=UPI0004183F8C|nr:S8 family serine peptidase [Microbacterium luticocti]
MSSPSRRSRGWAAAAGVVAAVLACTGAALPAQAAQGPGSSWWYDAFGVPEVQAQGWTGAGVKVAVIDGQINPELPVLTGAHLTVDPKPLCTGGTVTTTAPDPSNDVAHGSDMAALIVGNGSGPAHVRGIAPEADLLFYGFGYVPSSDAGRDCIDSPEDGMSVFGHGIQRAIDDGARVISISQGAGVMTQKDAQVVAEAIAHGVVIVAATPNSVADTGQWPWMYNGVVAVNAFDKRGYLQEDAQTPGKKAAWRETTVVAPGVGFPSVTWGTPVSVSGSSLATPLTAGVLALTAQKYPHATGDQLLQSLIRNTTPDDHGLAHSDDGTGYGPVSLRHMLRVDPTSYPDVNPLMDKSSNVPSAQLVAQVAGGASPTPTGVAPTVIVGDTATPAAGQADSATPAVPAVLMVGGGVVVVAAIVVIVAVTVRRRKGNGPPNTGGAS